jgi:predicted transcriptional regulator
LTIRAGTLLTGTPNAERRTPNAERRTPNAERRFPNTKRSGLPSEAKRRNTVPFSTNVVTFPVTTNVEGVEVLGKANITRAELEILRFVMDHEPVTVRQVADEMADRKGIARTTTQTLMDRLRAKEYLKRAEAGNLNLYSLAVEKGELLKALMDDFVETALGGSLSPFAAYLIEKADLTDEQAAELHRILDGSGPEENR